MKTNLYIDGFNLYYGALRGSPYRWLDLAQMCRLLLPAHDIHRLRYFTALVTPRPNNPSQLRDQLTYIRAIETTSNLTVHYGQFRTHAVRMPLVNPPTRGPKTAEVWRTEEKGSDVNLATFALRDAFAGDCEVCVLITNDSDLVEPVNIIRQELGLTVGILNPHWRASRDLARAATFTKRIRAGVLRSSQFPNVIQDSVGRHIRKLSGW